jgi:hypothetical protein
VILRSYVHYNRSPKLPVDVAAWRQQVERLEAHSPAVARLRNQMSSVTNGLAGWLKNHRHLVPTEIEKGESGMALLLLWEVDHAQPFPTSGARDQKAVLVGFSRRLSAQVAKDEELRAWLQSRLIQQPLMPGLVATHHTRWSVRVVPPGPGDPQDWYQDFTTRWKAYLATQTLSYSASSSSSSSSTAALQPPPPSRKRSRYPAASPGQIASCNVDCPPTAVSALLQPTPVRALPPDSAPPSDMTTLALAASTSSQPTPETALPPDSASPPILSIIALADSSSPQPCPVRATPPDLPRPRVRSREDSSTSTSVVPPPLKRQRDLRTWLRPNSASSGHAAQDVVSSSTNPWPGIHSPAAMQGGTAPPDVGGSSSSPRPGNPTGGAPPSLPATPAVDTSMNLRPRDPHAAGSPPGRGRAVQGSST